MDAFYFTFTAKYRTYDGRTTTRASGYYKGRYITIAAADPRPVWSLEWWLERCMGHAFTYRRTPTKLGQCQRRALVQVAIYQRSRKGWLLSRIVTSLAGPARVPRHARREAPKLRRGKATAKR